MAPRYCTLLSWAASILVFACLWSLDEDIFWGEGLTLLDLLLAPSCIWYVATFVWSSATGIATLLFTSKKPTRGCATITDKERQCEKRAQTTKAYKPKTASSSQENLHGARDVKTEEPVAHTEDKKAEEPVNEQLEELTLATAGIEATVEDVGKGGLPEIVEAKKENETEKAPAPTKSGKKEPPPPPPKKKDGGISSTKSEEKEEAKFRAFHWKKLAKHQGTIWSELMTPPPLTANLTKVVEDLFANDPPKRKAPKKSEEVEKAGTSSSGPRRILTPERSRNVMIMLRRFKAITGGVEEICKGLLTGRILVEDDLPILREMSPSNVEVVECAAYDGSPEVLEAADRAVWLMARIPRLRIKTECLLVVDNWQYNRKKATEMLEKVGEACSQLIQSERLRFTLSVVLSVGNVLNHGTKRAGATALRIESLAKMKDTKTTAADPHHRVGNLLEYVALVVLETHVPRTTAGSFINAELPSLVPSLRFLDGSLGGLLSEIWTGFENIEEELALVFGIPFADMEAWTEDQISALELTGAGPFPCEEHIFGQRLFQFLREQRHTRLALRERADEIQGLMDKVAQLLGEPSGQTAITEIAAFVELFDTAYEKLTNAE